MIVSSFSHYLPQTVHDHGPPSGLGRDSAARPWAWHAAVMAARTAASPPATGTAPVTIVVGEEEFLIDRAVRDLITARQDAGQAGDVHDLDGAALGPGELDSLTSPSLFGGGSVVVIRAAQNAAKEVAAELTRYAASPAPDVALIMTHA